MNLWIDPAIDAYHRIVGTSWPVDILKLSAKDAREQWPVDSKGKKTDTMKLRVWENWNRVFGRCRQHTVLADPNLWRARHFTELREFVDDILGKCLQYYPYWLTVPQLPLVDGGSRNKINHMLAEATMGWKTDRRFDGRLVLPLIFSNQRQINSKTLRDKKLAVAKKCFKAVGATALWIVDATLREQSRNKTFEARYAKLIELHKHVQSEFPNGTVVIAGPYWGMDLVLWARGLCDHPAITLGARYAYYYSCGAPRGGAVHVSIPPLRRWVVVNRELRAWVEKALNKLDAADPAHKKLRYIRSNFDELGTKLGASRFTGNFYKHWIDKIGSSPVKGRALGLYQDLSAAFVLGSQLPDLPASCLPNSSASIREPGKVAKQLMLNCL